MNNPIVLDSIPTAPPMPRLVARWETRGSRDWLELRCGGPGGYFYRGNSCGGSFTATNDGEALARMQAPWGDPKGAGAVTVLRSDRSTLHRVR